ncbi:rod shape-determining protein MreD [Streptomyces aidingensis]|uniref:Rod shape-determining protein MreD n=1 Tax=Streptomyces aidingensis TaxID=910347 RepID=A0A1I1FIJ3_9ACTN|nr:rod shape-determining protein MreD [Streptomyces aidingensis]SFB99091.1 rod shape-determining protein MreD [Streptomyces aidingensis]
MRVQRTLLTTLLVVVALTVQVSILARLQLPGAVPDLLLLTVLGLALVYGHTGGAVTGFFAGLVADLAPPADHAVGRYALVLCLVGYAAGLTRPDTGHRSATAPMLVVAIGAVSSTLLYAGVGTLVGDTEVSQEALVTMVTTATVYDLLLAPFVVPLVMSLARRLESDPLAGDGAASPAGESLGSSWLRPTGLRLGRAGRFGRARAGRAAVIGSQRSPLLGRSRGRLKGVKRL